MKLKIKILKYLELAVIIAVAMMIWYLADRIFGSADLNNWGWVTLAASIFFIVWSLGAIIIRDSKLFLATSFLALLTQLIFTRNVSSLVVIFISFLLLWAARKFTRREIKLRLKVDTWNYLRVSRRFLLLALALMLAGQYYFSKDVQIASENLPKLQFNNGQESLMTKIVYFVDPGLIKENNEAITVDEYIINKFNSDPLVPKRFGAEVDFGNINYYQQAVVLEGGREDISKMVERNVTGDEKMINIFLEVINNKIDDILNVSVGYVDKDMPVAHLIFTVAIFLAILGSGMLVSVFLIFGVAVVFRMLIFFDLLSIERKAVNMEIINIG